MYLFSKNYSTLLVVLLFLFTWQAGFAQLKINPGLKSKLDSIKILDQKYRNIDVTPSDIDSLSKIFNVPKDQVESYIWKLQGSIDSLNLIAIKDMINKYGYPGKSLVGEKTNEVAWYVIQHSKEIPIYLKMIKKAGRKNELSMERVATMEDRLLLEEGKEQIYGSQAQCTVLQGKYDCFIWPIKRVSTVNERRKKVGMKLTVEENAKRLGINYRIVTTKEVKTK